MRGMLTGLRIRGALGLDEQVAALPFRIDDLAGFRPVRVLAGNSVLLTLGPLATLCYVLTIVFSVLAFH